MSKIAALLLPLALGACTALPQPFARLDSAASEEEGYVATRGELDAVFVADCAYDGVCIPRGERVLLSSRREYSSQTGLFRDDSTLAVYDVGGRFWGKWCPAQGSCYGIRPVVQVRTALPGQIKRIAVYLFVRAFLPQPVADAFATGQVFGYLDRQEFVGRMSQKAERPK